MTTSLIYFIQKIIQIYPKTPIGNSGHRRSFEIFRTVFLVLLAVSIWYQNTYALEGTWRGLKIAKEDRCSDYKREVDYPYSQSVEQNIVESLGNRIYSPYSGKFFQSTEETDIEHIVSLSEAHDSGLCSRDSATKITFASDIRNLTLASPQVNRYEKKGHDAQGWLPEKNQCWFVKTVIDIKSDYDLSVDSEELVSLERVISNCDSFDMIVFKQEEQSRDLASVNSFASDSPAVKKSRTGICHLKQSSPYYSRTIKFVSFDNLQSCLNSGGRCPKRDHKCLNLASNRELVTDVQQQELVVIEQSDQASRGINEDKSFLENKEASIKKSKSGICHIRGSSSHYNRLKNFTIYSDLASCINSGGRCPKKDQNCHALTKEGSEKSTDESSKDLEKSKSVSVKKSRSGICHLKGSSSSYNRLKHFTPYDSLSSCLSSGGRCPKRDKLCQKSID